MLQRATALFGFLICEICGYSSAIAAPPTISSVYPAGASRGSTVEVTVSGTFDKWPVKAWSSNPDVRIESSKDKGKFTIAVGANAVPGVCWIRAANDDGASPLRPFIIGTLPEVMEKEPNDEPKTAQPISGNAVVNGKLEKAGDVDCFAITLTKGQKLVASLEANATLKSPMDAILQLVSADGFVLEQNHDFHGLDPQLAFTAPKDGTYIARVFAFPSNPDSSIRFFGADNCIYRLTLTTSGFADYPQPLAVPRENSGSVALAGWNIPDAAQALPVEPGIDDYVTVFHPEVANTARLRLEPHPCFDLKTIPKLVPPFSITARIEKPGTETPITFTAKKGQALSVQVQSRNLGLSVHPVIRILDADKKQVARAEPAQLNSDSALSFSPPVDGAYTIAVSDLLGGGGSRHVFLLRVLTPDPDYDLSVPQDRFNVPPGKPLDIPIKITRKNGFNKPVELVVEGLAEGIAWESKPADANAIVLSVALKGDKLGTGSTFRIVGRVKDEPKFTRRVLTPLPEYDTTTPDLWATVSAAAQPEPPKKK